MTIKKETVEKQIEELRDESQKLLQRRSEIAQENALINTRLSEIQGAMNVLVPLIKSQGTVASKAKPKK